MMRIALLGNSHLGALKRAWETGEKLSTANVELVFFGAPRDGLKRLEATEDGLRTTDPHVAKYLGLTSGRTDPVIRPTDFDAILMHGLVSRNWTVPAAGKLSRYLERDGSMPSSGLLQAVMSDEYSQSVQSHVVTLLKRFPSVQMLSSPSPYLSADSEHNGSRGVAHDHGLSDGYENFLMERLPAEGLTYLPQPQETVENRRFTRKTYFEDSERLLRTTGSDEDADMAHTNAAYGLLVLKALFAALKTSAVVKQKSAQRPPAKRKTRK